MSNPAPLHEVTNADFRPAEEHCKGARQLVAIAVSTSGKSRPRVLKCPKCPKESGVPSDLFRHVLMHTKEEPYVCKVVGCGKGFSFTASLTKHYIFHRKRGEVTWKRLDDKDDAKSHGSQSRQCQPNLKSGISSAVIPPVCLPKVIVNPDTEHVPLTSEQNSELQFLLMDTAIGEEIYGKGTLSRDGSSPDQWVDSDLLPDIELDWIDDLIIDPTDI